jgi:hypothetical protein
VSEHERPPEGKSIAELRRLVGESNARYDRVGEAWNDLSDAEQMRLVALAETLARGEPDPELASIRALLRDCRDEWIRQHVAYPTHDWLARVDEALGDG